MNYEQSGYAIWRAKFEAMSTCDFNGEVVLGDSQAQAAFRPRLYSPSRSSFNLALGGSTSAEVYLVFRKIIHCLRPGQRVLISINPTVLTRLAPWIWENGARYGLISFGDLKTIEEVFASVHDAAFYDFQTRFGSGIIRDFVYGFQFPAVHFENLIASRILFRKALNEVQLSRAKENRGYVPFTGQPGQIDGNEQEDKFRPLPGLVEAFRQIVILASRHGVGLDFIATPVPDSRADYVSDDYRDRFVALLEGLQNLSPGTMRVIGPLFKTMPDRFFADSWHLNEQGATAFSNEISQLFLVQD